MTPLTNPVLLTAALAAAVAAVLAARRSRFFAPAFSILPVPFWCYFLPMLASTFGFLPLESPVYSAVSRYVLPFCLAALLIGVDLRALASLTGRALAVMASGAGGIMLGAVAAYAALRGVLPEEAWKSVGALSASWIGGSANMLAVKESLAPPEAVFAPVVVVDTFLAYGWMAVLVSGAAYQARFDARFGAIDYEHRSGDAAASSRPLAPALAAALALAALAIFAGDRIPALGSIVTHTTWTVLLVTTLALAASLTGAFGGPALEKAGTTILYILLASMGARVRLTAILDAPAFLLLGFIMLAVHAAVLLLAGRRLRAPLFLMATASQACVGGPVSAPIVAAVYRPALAAVGLLMAVLGNVTGTYLGLVTARICEWVGR